MGTCQPFVFFFRTVSGSPVIPAAQKANMKATMAFMALVDGILVAVNLVLVS